MTHRMEVIEGNCRLLHQAADLLRSLDDAAYAEAGRAPEVSPVGVHFRHLIDHYQAFFHGLPEGRIDYDARHRLTPMETDRRLALATVLGLIGDLERITDRLAAGPIEVSTRSAGDGQEPDWSGSTIKRELQFLVSHTVHHFALIKPLLLREGIAVYDQFGLAPSTLAASR